MQRAQGKGHTGQAGWHECVEALGGARKQDLLYFLGRKSMACFLIAGQSLGTDSQPKIPLLAAFMSHRCASEWRCQLATLLGAGTFISPYEDHPSAKFHPTPPWKDRKMSSELDTRL